MSDADSRAMARQAAGLAMFDTGEAGDDATRQAMIDQADADQQRLAIDRAVDEAYVVEHSTTWGVDARWRALRGGG